MHSQQSLSPFDTLLGLEKELIISGHKPLSLSSDKSAKGGDWVGIVFLSGDLIFLIPLEEVVEILKVRHMATVPGVKPWLRGMTICRGSELCPVTDLSGFVTRKMSSITSHSRVLVISHQEEYSGILVNRVLGLQRLPAKNKRQATMINIEKFQPFIIGAFINENTELPVISGKLIVGHPDFFDVGLKEDELT
jgi:twitching motility protein PilI